MITLSVWRWNNSAKRLRFDRFSNGFLIQHVVYSYCYATYLPYKMPSETTVDRMMSLSCRSVYFAFEKLFDSCWTAGRQRRSRSNCRKYWATVAGCSTAHCTSVRCCCPFCVIGSVAPTAPKSTSLRRISTATGFRYIYRPLLLWQLRPKVVQTVQQHVSDEFIWIRRTCDYLVECSLLPAVQ